MLPAEILSIIFEVGLAFQEEDQELDICDPLVASADVAFNEVSQDICPPPVTVQLNIPGTS